MAHHPTLEQTLRQLIASPSISGALAEHNLSNLGVIHLLADWLEALGFQTTIQSISEQPSKANLIARIGPDSPHGLLLSGHTDTVPCNPELWDGDPFTLREADGRYYGLGSVDMKGFFALLLEALRTMDLSRLRQPLIVVASADEESSMLGAAALTQLDWLKADRALIGEPTGLRPIHAHKGIMMESIRLIGRSGHSSNPAGGISALDGMTSVLNALTQWRHELQQFHDPHFVIPHPTLNLGYIHGGDSPNRICGECMLHIDLRPLPGMQLEQLRQQLHERVRDAVEGSGLQIECQPLFAGTHPLETDPNHPFVKELEQLSGHQATTAAYGTEGHYFSSMGMDTVILGPGDIEQAHQPNEFLDQRYIQPTIQLLQQLIANHCY